MLYYSHQIRRCWYNIVPKTFQFYVVYGQKTYTCNIFNRPKVICVAGQNMGFCWPLHDVLCGPNKNSFSA